MSEPKSLHEIYMDRNRESRRRMEAYDESVFRTAIKELRQWCEQQGHIRGKWHNNGLGWSWFYCNRCGDRMEIEGPDGQKEPCHD
ncbi:MAG TPA: hypothetical protein PKA88_30670 [Polyangiaceae bacterium]|nr:hypothetical protein [Polyangiaceae bacterium]